jgi:AcrR family transcriptional regulator
MHHAHAAAVAGGSGSPPSAARRRRAGSGERRPAGHADSRLPQVLDAAAQLFCHFGYQGATLRGIAQAVDMLPGSIYSHFAAKEDLLVAVYRRGVDQIIAAVEQAVQPQGSTPGRGWKRPASRTSRPSCATTTTRVWWCACGRPTVPPGRGA